MPSKQELIKKDKVERTDRQKRSNDYRLTTKKDTNGQKDK